MIAAKLCAIHLLPDVLMDRSNSKQRESESSSALETPFSFGHKLLLTSIVFAAFLRMVEYSLFPSLYQRIFQTEEEQTYYLENSVEFCQPYVQIKSNIGRSGGLELLVYFIHELCWFAIFFPLPYMFVPEKWDTAPWYSKLRQSSSSFSDLDSFKMNSLWKDIYHWFMRPAHVQPLRISSTTCEEMALLVMLGMMGEECARNDQQEAQLASSLGIISEGAKKKKEKKNDHSLHMLDSTKYLGTIMNNNGTSSKSSSAIHSIINQHKWICADPWSELRYISVTLIIIMALVRLYSFLSLINFELFEYFLGTAGPTDTSQKSIMALDRLVVFGFYGVTRNPMCLASLGSAIGLLCASPSPMGMLALPILYSLMSFHVSNEEKELLCYYGDAYVQYMNKVPRFLGLPDFVEDFLYITSSISPENCKIIANLVSEFIMALVWFIYFLEYGGLRPLVALIQGNCYKKLQDGGDAIFEGKLRAAELLYDYQFEKTLEVEDRLYAKQKERKMADLVTGQHTLLKQTKQIEGDLNSETIFMLKSLERKRVQYVQNSILSRLSSMQTSLANIGLMRSLTDITNDESKKRAIIKQSCNSLRGQRDGGVWKKCLLISDKSKTVFKLYLDISSRRDQSNDPLPFLFSAKRLDEYIYISPYYNFPKSLGNEEIPGGYYCAVLVKDSEINGQFKMYQVDCATTNTSLGNLLLTVSIETPLELEQKSDQLCSVRDDQVKVNLSPSTENNRDETELSSLRVVGFVDDRVSAFSPQNMFLVRQDSKAKSLGAFDVWLQVGKRMQCDGKTHYALDFDYQMCPLEAFGVVLCMFAV